MASLSILKVTSSARQKDIVKAEENYLSSYYFDSVK